MSYTPTNWKAKDKVTSEKLNKIENGIAAAGDNLFAVKFNYVQATSTVVCNKTFNEIKAEFDVRGKSNMIAIWDGVSSCAITTINDNDDQPERFVFSFWYSLDAAEFGHLRIGVSADAITGDETLFVLTPEEGDS